MTSSPAGAECVFGVVVPSLCVPSETFLREHIWRIAPGRTAVMCFDARGAHKIHRGPLLKLDMPFLPRKRGLLRTAFKAWLFLTRGSELGLRRAQSRELGRSLRNLGVSIVLAEYGPSGWAVAKACTRAGVRLFVHFHGYDAATCGKWHRRIEYRRLVRSAEKFICPSRFTAAELASIGIPEDKLAVVHYGVDVDRFRPTTGPREPGLVLAVGRFTSKKAPHLVLKAFTQVLRSCPNAKLEMIGGGPLMPHCEALVADAGMAPAVTFHGVRDHQFVLEKLRRASIFVQHSVTAPSGDAEGLPLTLLEAMACELPVVATRHNGITETVVEGETGFLVDEHDTASMAARVCELLPDAGLRRRMGQAGRRRVIEHFSARCQIRKLRSVLGLPVEDEAYSRPAPVRDPSTAGANTGTGKAPC